MLKKVGGRAASPVGFDVRAGPQSELGRQLRDGQGHLIDQVGDPPHGQARQAGDLAACVLSDREREGVPARPVRHIA
ncbi:hypothetical protein GCM10027073_57120 [Streptomyces chlorus]